MSEAATWYFAYGSNMSRTIFCERRRMHPMAARWAWLLDHALRFDLPIGPGERGVANVVPHPGERVCGVAYLVPEIELEQLDRSEGVPRGFYQRVPVEVVLEDGEALSAFSYRSGFSSPGRRPSARYLGLLLEGARQHGLPREYVEFLAAFELAWDERGGPVPPPRR